MSTHSGSSQKSYGVFELSLSRTKSPHRFLRERARSILWFPSFILLLLASLIFSSPATGVAEEMNTSKPNSFRSTGVSKEEGKQRYTSRISRDNVALDPRAAAVISLFYLFQESSNKHPATELKRREDSISLARAAFRNK